MLRFCGFDLELVIDSVLERRGDQPAVCAATDPADQLWLIVEAAHREPDLSWLCAPVSSRVMELVSDGRASAIDAVRHSRTGWVEVVRVVDGHAVPDERVACAQLTAGESMPGLTPV
jgi:hypothetical protein